MIKRANRVDESAEKVMQSLRGKSFESVFKMEVDRESGAISYRIKGSGVTGRPTDAPLTNAVTHALASQGVTFKSGSTGSAANRDSYHLSAQFEDGGLEAKTGDYWYAVSVWQTHIDAGLAA